MSRGHFQFTFLVVLLVYGATADSVALAQPKKSPAPDLNTLQSCNFESVELMEVGLAPNGQLAKGRWHVNFGAGDFSWHHSDVVEKGTFVFDKEKGIVSFTFVDRKQDQGQFDPKTEILTWRKVNYRLLKEGQK